MQLGKRKLKLEKSSFYLYKNVLVRIKKISSKFNALTIERFDTFQEEIVELDTAPFFLEPMYRIGEVGKMLQRSPETIRKYERLEYIPKAKKYQLSEDGKNAIRFYTQEDILELADWFAARANPGRPTKHWSKINRVELNQRLNAKYKEK